MLTQYPDRSAARLSWRLEFLRSKKAADNNAGFSSCKVDEFKEIVELPWSSAIQNSSLKRKQAGTEV
jgi:hypothetical protein